MEQIAGDAPGSQVEFQTLAEIRTRFLNGCAIYKGAQLEKPPGQPIDISGMALALARTLVRLGQYDKTAAFQTYQAWLAAGPFDCGGPILRPSQGSVNPKARPIALSCA